MKTQSSSPLIHLLRTIDRAAGDKLLHAFVRGDVAAALVATEEKKATRAALESVAQSLLPDEIRSEILPRK